MTGFAAVVASLAVFVVVVAVVSLLDRGRPTEPQRPGDVGQLARSTVGCAAYCVALIVLGIAALVALAVINPA